MNNTRARIKIFFSTFYEFLFIIQFNPLHSFMRAFELARDTKFYDIANGRGYIASGREFSSDEITMMENSLLKFVESQKKLEYHSFASAFEVEADE